MKKIFLFITTIVIINFCKAQTYDTTTYYGKMNFIFNNISHTQITTGLLRDYGIDFLNLDNYTGAALNDSNFVSLDEWRLLYASLYSDHINSNGSFLALDTLNRLFTSKSYSCAGLPACA